MKLKKLALLSATVATGAAFAGGSVTVEKVQGTKALVKFDGQTPVKGETYELGGGGGGGAGTRNMYLGLSTDLISKSFGTAGPLAISLSATPGWNMGQFEFGVPVAVGYTKTTTDANNSSNTMSFLLGFAPEYNFSDNAPGTMMIPYLGANFKFGLLKSGGKASGVALTSTTTKSMFFGGELGLKYFLNDQVAITAALAFEMTRMMTTPAVTTKTLSIPLSVRAYF